MSIIIAEHLEAAAGLMEVTPWYVSGHEPSILDGRSICAAIAIEKAIGGSSEAVIFETMQALVDYLGLDAPEQRYITSAIFRWNDAQASKKDVIAKLRACAMVEREKEKI